MKISELTNEGSNPGGSWANVRKAMYSDNPSGVKTLTEAIEKIQKDMKSEYDHNEIKSFVEHVVTTFFDN